MSPEGRTRIEKLYHAALEREPQERAAFLAAACGGDEALLKEVQSLIGQSSIGQPGGSIIGRTIGHFRILEKLGRGGMGVVYKALDVALERPVALKFLPVSAGEDEEALTRLRIEAKAASSLDHPNICTIFEIASTPEGGTFIAMAYYEGETLQAKLRRGPLCAADAVDVAGQMGHALGKAHSQGIVHRDIKPGNIMLTADGTVKILDFGLAKVSSSPSITRAGATVGTIQYMSPEQARGGVLDHRSDIWSWGAVLFEMLTGQRPFRSTDPMSLMRAIVFEPPNLAPLTARQVPEGIVRVICRALTKDLQERYQDMTEALGHLREAASGTAPSVRRQPELQATPTSIAVLPFRNLSRNADDEYFSEGLAEDLINALTRINGLHVASRASSFAFKNSSQAMREIGERLRVGMVLEGSVRRAGSRLRVSVQLVDAVADRGIWSERYDRDAGDLFSIQDEIAGSIVQKLRLRLGDSTVSRLVRRYTENLQAYHSYLRGRYQFNRSTPQALLMAVEAFEEAAAQDPGYVLPYCGIGDCYVVLGAQAMVPPLEAWKKLGAAAERALQIDPQVAEAHACKAAVLATDFDWAGAEREFLRALELDADCANAHHWYAVCLLSPLGRSDEAIREIKLALGLEPLSLVFSASAAWLYYLAGRFDLAVEQCRTTLEMEPGHVTALWCMGSSCRELGRYADAMAAFEKVQTISSEDPISLGLIGHFYAATGKADQARQVLEKLRMRARHQYVSAMYMVWILAALGDFDGAFAALDEAYENRDFLLRNIRRSQGTRPLMNDPRFEIMIRKLGLDAPGTHLTQSMSRPVTI